MSTVWIDGELDRIATEMFAREAAADIFVVEAGAVVSLPSAPRVMVMLKS